jgi:hypothetical protein
MSVAIGGGTRTDAARALDLIAFLSDKEQAKAAMEEFEARQSAATEAEERASVASRDAALKTAEAEALMQDAIKDAEKLDRAHKAREDAIASAEAALKEQKAALKEQESVFAAEKERTEARLDAAQKSVVRETIARNSEKDTLETRAKSLAEREAAVLLREDAVRAMQSELDTKLARLRELAA